MKRSFLILSSALLMVFVSGCATNDYEDTYLSPLTQYMYLEDYKALAKVADINDKSITMMGRFTSQDSANYGKSITMMGGYASQERANLDVLYHCENLFGTRCLLSREGEKNVWKKNYEEYELEQAQKRLVKLEQEKRALINEFVNRCIDFGFKTKSEIATCVQQEAFNERQIALQKLAQEKEQVQQINVVVADAEAEVNPFLEWLGELTEEVIEDYFDQQEHDRMHQNDRKDIFRNCRPNCFDNING